MWIVYFELHEHHLATVLLESDHRGQEEEPQAQRKTFAHQVFAFPIHETLSEHSQQLKHETLEKYSKNKGSIA
jgi:hypothetical protein